MTTPPLPLPVLKPTAARALYRKVRWTTIATTPPPSLPTDPKVLAWVSRPCPALRPDGTPCGLVGEVHGHASAAFPQPQQETDQ
jgi:hypothetical protein